MKKIILLSVFLLLILGVFYFYKNLRTNFVAGIDIDTEEKQLDEKENNKDLGYKIEVLPIASSLANMPAPDLNRKVNFSTASENSKTKIEEISKALKTDTNNTLLWIDLGSWRKGINDYEGAIEAWEYVITIAPRNSIALNNLGDLYAYYLKDILKAEGYFLQAINNDPNNIYLYFKIVDFYRYVAKDTAKARAILEQGIAANPAASSDLQNLLETLK